MIRNVLAVLVALTLVSPAFAGDKPDKKGKGGGHPGWDELVKKLDKDGDGQISKDELAAAKAEHEKKQGEEPKAPENGEQPKKGKGGKKGGGERPHPLAKNFDEIDANKDGKISKDEFQAWVEKQKEKHQEKKGKKPEAPKPEEPKPEEPKK